MGSPAKKPSGPYADKLWREALRKAVLKRVEKEQNLDRIARAVVTKAVDGDIVAAKEIGDRLDGKPAQESMVTIDDKRDAADWTREELVTFLNDCRNGGNGTTEADGSNRKSDSVH